MAAAVRCTMYQCVMPRPGVICSVRTCLRGRELLHVGVGGGGADVAFIVIAAANAEEEEEQLLLPPSVRPSVPCVVDAESPPFEPPSHEFVRYVVVVQTCVCVYLQHPSLCFLP